MQYLYLYKNGFPRRMKIDEPSYVMQYLATQSYKRLAVEGCYITNTNNYVDIEIEGYWNDISTYSYLRVEMPTDSVYGKGIFANIDRIEPNNFNKYEDIRTSSFRIYYTVDWWTTLLCNRKQGETFTFASSIYSNLEGVIDRCHITDVRPVGNRFIADLSKTKLEREFELSYKSVSSQKLGYNDKYFLYIISTELALPLQQEDKRNILNMNAKVQIAQRTMPVPLYLYVIPLFACKIRYSFYRVDDQGNTYVATEEVEANRTDLGVEGGSFFTYTPPMPEVFTDRKIVSIYCTNIMPQYSVDDNMIIYDTPVQDEKNAGVYRGASMFDLAFDNANGDHVHAYRVPITLSSKQYVKNNFIKTGSDAVEKPTTYLEYLNSIQKQYFPPYVFYSISNGKDEIVLNTAYMLNDVLFEYNVIPSLGSVGFYVYDQLQVEESRYKYLSTGTYNISAIDDDVTALRDNALAVRLLGSKISTGVGVAKTITGKGIKSVSSASKASESIGAVYNIKADKLAMEICGETGYEVSSEALRNYLTPIIVTRSGILNDERQALIKDLALYGYNTYLHPHQVLYGNDHKRRHFNYIKTNSANLTTTFLTTEQRLQIEEMFNNGVWIWHDFDTFGNFEINNYPLIFDY